ncbi:divalent-cation tolerance protein CutA [Bryobacter aggregatus]|uniref:divalent-cation tolerance protein CutA n=1 Tax=Bryobacter aggregatus TaxID=360054 RepID=UPI0004E260CE|nr:divalent-cation tolerance protein CutA [Bryobacter aggregatus]
MKFVEDFQYRLLFSTAPNLEVAKSIARTLLEKHLVACVSLVPNVESLYHWDGKLEESSEVLLIMKTDRDKQNQALAALSGLHPYDTPEGIAVPIVHGLERYLDWIRTSLKD